MGSGELLFFIKQKRLYIMEKTKNVAVLLETNVFFFP